MAVYMTSGSAGSAPEFKAETVRLVRESDKTKTIAQIARDL